MYVAHYAVNVRGRECEILCLLFQPKLVPALLDYETVEVACGETHVVAVTGTCTMYMYIHQNIIRTYIVYVYGTVANRKKGGERNPRNPQRKNMYIHVHMYASPLCTLPSLNSFSFVLPSSSPSLSPPSLP